MQINWSEVGIVGGALITLGIITRFILLPLVEKSMRNILKPELEKIDSVLKTVTKLANELGGLVHLVQSLDEEMTDVFKVMRTHRDLLADLNESVPAVFGVERREEAPRRRVTSELPHLPERRRIYRRIGDES